MKILLALLLMSTSLFAEEFSSTLEVLGVRQSKSNSYATGKMKEYYSCDQFEGTYAGNSVVLKPVARGGSGSYSHRIVFTLGEGYQKSHGDRRQKDVYITPGYSYNLKLPELRDDVPFVQQSVMLITTDKRTGLSYSSTLMFNVSRPVVLKKSNDRVSDEKECFEVYPAYQSPIGILSNGSTNPSQLMIKQGITKLWTSLSGAQWGFYFSPLAWSGLANIFMYNRGYFTQYSKQVSETVEVSSSYQLSPGDYIQIYEQRTRYVSAFDAHVIGVCGESELLEEDYMLQWWGVAYHAVPVNPFDEENIPLDTIGAYPRSTCSEEYSDGYSDAIQFVRTN